MNKTFLNGSLILIGFLNLILLIFSSSCQTDEDVRKVNALKSDSTFSELTTEAVINFYDSGYLKAIIKAPVLERLSQINQTRFNKGVNGVFLDANGQEENRFRSEYAISYDDKKLIELKNDVQLDNIKNEQLNTELLIWDQKTRKIYTDKFVKITTPENIIYGNGFESNQEFTSYKIFKVSGVVNIEDAKDN